MDILEKLRDTHNLTAQEYKSLLINENSDFCNNLYAQAREVSTSVFGNTVFIRGLIEVSNHCKNNCYYCGIRAANQEIERYRLSKEEILGCCRRGHELGFRTFVLQGGEDPALSDEWTEDLVRSIRAEFPDCAITLSLGEKSAESYQTFKEAGADRYLLRHETFNQEHYSRLHPAGMSRDNRLKCLANLKANGYQTGTGIMVGSPYQSIDNIVEDLMFIQEFKPEMIGIGPFIHHHGTPFAGMPDGSVELTLKLISIFRLMNPHALIPATTALNTLCLGGRTQGILAGANVVMPNLTPATRRGDYSLYEGKAASGAEAAEGLEQLRNELKAIGYDVIVHRGDYAEEYNNDRKCIM